MLQDVRYSFRLLLKNKTFTLVAVLSLGIGIGANTALFGVIDAAVFRELQVNRPDELVVFDSLTGPNFMLGGHSGIGGRDAGTGLRRFTSFSRHTFDQIRSRQDVLSSVFVFAPMDQNNVNVDGSSEIALGQVVTGDYFQGLGVSAALGRTIAPADDDAAANPVVVISHEYWIRRFKADPQVIGMPKRRKWPS